MLRAMVIGITVAVAAGHVALAGDRIVGDWRTQPGDTAAISSCGKAFCIVLKDGDYAGMQVGRVTPKGDGIYVGSITNPEDGKVYNGNGTLAGDRLTMSGCVFGGLICKRQVWSRL